MKKEEKQTEQADFLNKSSFFNSYGISIEKRTVNTFYPLHWHDCWELEVVTAGNGSQVLNGKKHTLTRGAVYLLSPTDFHEVESRNLSLYTVCFRDEKLPEDFIRILSGGKGTHFRVCSEEELQPFLQVCDMLYRECEKQGKKGSQTAVEHLLGFLFVLLIRLFEVDGEEEENENIPTLAARAVSYVHLHFRENPSLSLVASRLCVTPNYLSERFHAATGKRYKEYLTEVKLRYAKTLLETVDISATEACFTSGFSSFSNFLRQFKARYGVPPGQWRHKKNGDFEKSNV